MFCRIIGLCVFVLSTASCGGSKVSVQDSWQEQEAVPEGGFRKLPDERLALVSVSPSTGAALVECVEEALYKQEPDLALIPSREFRDSMFPWFEPGIAPEGIEKLETVMTEAGVKRRIGELSLRFLVTLSGGTITRPGSWGGCIGGGMGAACVGGMSSEKQTDLTARILDLTSLEEVGQIEASGSGKSEVGMIVIIPYFVASSAESETCAALATRIVGFLKGG